MAKYYVVNKMRQDNDIEAVQNAYIYNYLALQLEPFLSNKTGLEQPKLLEQKKINGLGPNLTRADFAGQNNYSCLIVVFFFSVSFLCWELITEDIYFV